MTTSISIQSANGANLGQMLAASERIIDTWLQMIQITASRSQQTLTANPAAGDFRLLAQVMARANPATPGILSEAQRAFFKGLTPAQLRSIWQASFYIVEGQKEVLPASLRPSVALFYRNLIVVGQYSLDELNSLSRLGGRYISSLGSSLRNGVGQTAALFSQARDTIRTGLPALLSAPVATSGSGTVLAFGGAAVAGVALGAGVYYSGLGSYCGTDFIGESIGNLGWNLYGEYLYIRAVKEGILPQW